MNHTSAVARLNPFWQISLGLRGRWREESYQSSGWKSFSLPDTQGKAPHLIMLIILEAPSWLASLITKRAYTHNVMKEVATCTINCNVLMTQPVNTQQTIFNKLFLLNESGPKICLPTICSDLNVCNSHCSIRATANWVLFYNLHLQSYKSFKATKSQLGLIKSS